MILLYISKLSGSQYAGPNYSVPAQITAQSKHDEVYWLNLSNCDIQNDKEGLSHNISDISGTIPDDLPAPFNKPDLVIFEEFYSYPFNKIVYRLVRKKTPYIIVPRSQMTYQAKRTKRTKKLLAGFLFFNWFVRNAKAIHYLTEAEKNDSKKYNAPSFVIPNGIELPINYAHINHNEGLKLIYVGRINLFQKGIDVLLEACGKIKTQLREKNVHISLYGPSQIGGTEKAIKRCTELKIGDIVDINGPVYGDEKAEKLKKSDIFIMTSRFEGMPMGLIEALSYGLPCIVTPGTNMMDEIVNGGAGIGCEFSAEKIAEAILIAIAKQDELKIMGSKARNLAENYSWAGIARKTHVLYEEITKQ